MDSFSSFPDDESEFLDAHPLCPLDDDSDDFDAFLDGQYDERFLAGSLSQKAEVSSSTLDADYEEMRMSMDKFSFSTNMEDADVESDQKVSYEPVYQRKRPSPRRSRSASARNRSPSPSRNRFEVRRNYSLQPQTVSAFGNLDQVPFDNQDDNVSVCSFNTTNTTLTSNTMRASNSTLSSNTTRAEVQPTCFSTSPITQAMYNEALEKLAQTMKRTEESRRQVMIQREILKAQEEEMQRRSSMSHRQPLPRDPQTPSPDNIYIVDAFFSGSRNTLTTGLEQSRKQLRMYMNQINNQAL